LYMIVVWFKKKKNRYFSDWYLFNLATSIYSPITLCRSWLCGISGVISRVRARAEFSLGTRYQQESPKADAPLIWSRETEAQAVKSSTTLDSDSLRKIPREKFGTKIILSIARTQKRRFWQTVFCVEIVGRWRCGSRYRASES
jgi:hypothetical protein